MNTLQALYIIGQLEAGEQDVQDLASDEVSFVLRIGRTCMDDIVRRKLEARFWNSISPHSEID